jgi:hypothetical protein
MAMMSTVGMGFPRGSGGFPPTYGSGPGNTSATTGPYQAMYQTGAGSGYVPPPNEPPVNLPPMDDQVSKHFIYFKSS